MLRPTLLLLAALALVGGCKKSSEIVLDTGEMRVLEARTYAWVDDGVRGPEGAQRVLDATVLREARERLSEELEGRGFTQTSEEDAALLMSLRLDKTVEIREFDPFFSMVSLERYERGHLTVGALVPASLDPVWIATDARNLRVTERAMTRERTRWEKLDTVPEWKIETMVDELMEQFPITE